MTRQEGCGRLFQLGVGAEHRDILGNKTEIKRVSVGGNEKRGQRDEGGESITVSLCTNADKRADCEEDRGVAGSESLEPEIVLETAFWPQKNQEHCATERVSGSLQITLAKSVLGSRFLCGASRFGEPLTRCRLNAIPFSTTVGLAIRGIQDQRVKQWFSTGGHFGPMPTPGHLVMSGHILGCNGGLLLLASRGRRQGGC